MASISDCAAARVTPGFSRPMMVSQNDPRWVNSCSNGPIGVIGVQNSASSGWANVSGITPRTSYEAPFSMIARPTIAGSAPIRCGQNPCARITTRLTAGRAVRRGECAASRGRRRQRVEEFPGVTRAADLRRIAEAGQREARARIPGDPLERLARTPPVLEVRIRADVLVEPLPRVVGPQHHQPVGLRVGQRPQQHRVDDGEDRGIRADAERQRERRDRGRRAAFFRRLRRA